MNKNFVLVVVGVLVGAFLLGAGVFLAKPSVSPPAGAVSGDNLAPTGYYTVNGVQYFANTIGFTATSSTVCQFTNPFAPATSTIESFAARISSSSPTGTGISVGSNAFDLSTTSNSFGYGSSTPALVYGHTVAASATLDQVAWFPQRVASSTLSGSGRLFSDAGANDGNSPFFLAGTNKLTYRIASGTPATFTT